MSRVHVIVSLDTRPGWLEQDSHVGKTGEGSLHGVRSADFILDAAEMVRVFFCGWETQVHLYIDIHEEIPTEIAEKLLGMQRYDRIQRVVLGHNAHDGHRWNDKILLNSYRLVDDVPPGDFVCHIDGDVTLLRRHDSTILQDYERWLSGGEYKYVCQPAGFVHNMQHASSRYWLALRENVDVDELERCLNDKYRHQRHSLEHAPCMEFIQGFVAGKGTVLYPPLDLDSYAVLHWCRYRSGLLPKLLDMPYSEQRAYIARSGLGALLDFIPEELL